MERSMSFIGDFIGDVFGGVTGAKQAGQAAERAGATQAAAAEKGIEEQRRQFDKLVELMSPYVTAGTEALGGLRPFQEAGQQAFQQQQAIAGLLGPEAQRLALQQIESSPLLQAQIKRGEESLLQRASATGGLRGGNIQAALAQFSPQMLQQEVEQQYGRLGGFAGTGLGITENLYGRGQAAATGQAASGITSASNIANLLANQGQAIAGGQVARGNVARQTFGDVLGIAKTAAGFF
jgi:hypothetical protein